MFRLSSEPLDTRALKDALRTPRAGAYAAFEGWVRDHNEGRRVERLEYEAYPEMAVQEGERILAEARERWPICEAVAVHRVGALRIGDMAVWVGVSAPHRDEAFQACRYIIDAVKHRVPIWKKEHYTGGDSGWVNCDRCAHHAHVELSEAAFYTRQTRLREVGDAGQDRLRSSRVLVVGAGGLGVPALLYLAAAGVGRIGICDRDVVEVSNLHRQPLFTLEQAGQLKAQIAADRLRAQNPFLAVTVHAERLTEANAAELCAPYDILLDCTDNFDAKFLLSDTAVRLKKTLVTASIYQYEGQLQVYRPGRSACLRCLWPEQPEAGCVGSCADVGVLGTVPAIFGSLQAMETLKLVLDLPGQLDGEMLLYDCLRHTSQRIAVARNPECPACGSGRLARADNGAVDVDPATLDTRGFGAYVVVDIREEGEPGEWPLPEVTPVSLPMSRFDLNVPPIDSERPVLLCCARGVRSLSLARYLRRAGYANVYSLKGGIAALAALAQR